MAIELFRAATANLDRLRFAGTAKRVRGSRAGTPVVDTTDALLVWEPRHVVPEYAVPADAITVDLVEVTSAAEPDPAPPIVLPGSFEVHLTPGTSLAAASEGEDAPAIAFRPDDPDLHGHVILDFSAFDWLEESEPIMGHPHDPFQRIDCLASDRHVVVSVGGEVVADSTRAIALYETQLPTRWYLPREDVRMDLMHPSDTHSVCAYKGRADYLSTAAAADVAWFYPDPLHDALPVADRIAFWNERCEITVDGQREGGRMPGV